jgi:hypothetical protein
VTIKLFKARVHSGIEIVVLVGGVSDNRLDAAQSTSLVALIGLGASMTSDNLGKGIWAEEFGDFGYSFYSFAPIPLPTLVCSLPARGIPVLLASFATRKSQALRDLVVSK